MSAVAVLSQPAKCSLPVQSIPKSTSAKIEDKEGKLVAHCALVQCTKAQAYLIVQQLDREIAPKAISLKVPDMDRPFDMRIETIKNVCESRHHLPMYIRVHYDPDERYPLEHLVDLLAEAVLGRHNLTLRKNLTIDLFDSASDAIIRDGAGFLVADQHRLQQITVEAKQASGVLKSSKELVMARPSTENEINELVEYDATLSNHQREDFVRFMLKNNDVLVAYWSPEILAENARQKAAEESENEEKRGKAKKEDENGPKNISIAGYLISSKEFVSGIYAENEKIAESLLSAYIDKKQPKMLSLFCCIGQWDKLRALSTLQTRQIYRRHTRMVPMNVKYEKIFGWNIGTNFF